MLAISAQQTNGIYEKILRGKDGRLYSVCFTVVLVNGQFLARVLNATPVCTLTGSCLKKNKSVALFLVGKTTDQKDFFEQKLNEGTFSVFSNLDFFTSQMTRAPSL